MKLLKSCIYVAASLALMTACSNDEPKGEIDDPAVGRDGFYMSININPTQGNNSRSQTDGENSSSDGVEVGSDVENAINTAVIVLAGPDNKFITSASVPSSDNKGSIAAGTVDGTALYQAVAKFDKTEIATYYSTPGATTKGIHVFVFCNPTAEFLTALGDVQPGDTDWTNLEWSYTNQAGQAAGTLWDATKGFMMSNVSIAERDLPPTITEWSNYSTPLKAFDLSGNNAPGTIGAVDNLSNGRGSVLVQRLAARLDFRDGSQMEGSNGVPGKPFTYAVVKNVKGETIVNVEIHSMALTNMINKQYYLGRVSDNGRLTGDNYQLCGPEKPWFNDQGGNYVVSSYSEQKYAEIKSNFSNYFVYPFFANTGTIQQTGNGWDWINCSEVIKGQSDNYGAKSYKVWRYLTENTIPGNPSHQVNSQSTGVVFKGHILPTDALNDTGSDKWEKMLYDALNYNADNVGTGKLLHKDRDLDPTLYSLSGNSLYVTWENVREAALAEAGFDATKGQNQDLDRNAPLYRLIYGTGGVGTVKDDQGKVVFTDDLAQENTCIDYKWQTWDDARKANPNSQATQTAMSAFKKDATEAGFTLYQSSEDPQTHVWGYYCYYYYWNRHNDNLQDGVMGRMEFAVVRNNVYKLAVVTINTLGHPRIPENDPDDPKPDTPDEKSEVYITVSVEVVPWVVRVNNIHF